MKIAYTKGAGLEYEIVKTSTSDVSYINVNSEPISSINFTGDGQTTKINGSTATVEINSISNNNNSGGSSNSYFPSGW